MRQRLLAFASSVLLLWGTFGSALVRVEYATITIGRVSHDFGESSPTLADIIWRLLVSNPVLGLLLAICMFIFPLLLRLKVMQVACNRAKNEIEVKELVLRHWSLLPLLILSVLVIVCKQSSSLPPVRLGWGVLYLCLSEIALYFALRRCNRTHIHCETTTVNRPRFQITSGRTLTGICLCYFSITCLIPAFLLPFVSVTIAGLYVKGPYSLLAGIQNLYLTGDWILASVLLVFSVFFPLAKSMLLCGFLNFSDSHSHQIIEWLERLGPWSMLDSIVVILIAGAYGSVPFANITVSTEMGFWCFVGAVLVNAITLHVVGRYANFIDEPSSH